MAYDNPSGIGDLNSQISSGALDPGQALQQLQQMLGFGGGGGGMGSMSSGPMSPGNFDMNSNPTRQDPGFSIQSGGGQPNYGQMQNASPRPQPGNFSGPNGPFSYGDGGYGKQNVWGMMQDTPYAYNPRGIVPGNSSMTGFGETHYVPGYGYLDSQGNPIYGGTGTAPTPRISPGPSGNPYGIPGQEGVDWASNTFTQPGTYAVSGGGIGGQSQAGPHFNMGDNALDFLKSLGGDIPSSLQSLFNGQPVGQASNLGQSLMGLGGWQGGAPSPQSLGNMNPSELDFLQGFFQSLLGIPMEDVMNGVMQPFNGLNSARPARKRTGR